jgi:drug/metabolite transporter (DMT)-like permease
MWHKFLPSTLSAASYASAVIFVRFAYNAGITPGTAVFLRFLLACIALGAYLRLTGRWQTLLIRQAASLFLLGLLAYTLLGITWFVSLSTTPVWLVSLFGAVSPVVVSFGSWLFLRESISWQQIAALTAVVLGGMLIFWQPFESRVTIGLVLMSLNVLINAVYVLVGQGITRRVPPVQSAFWMISGAALGTLLYALTAGQLSLVFQPQGWLWVAMFAIFSTALAISFLWWGINLLGPSKAAIIGSMETVFSVSLAVLLLGERLDALQVVGAALILVGVMLVRR